MRVSREERKGESSFLQKRGKEIDGRRQEKEERLKAVRRKEEVENWEER